MSSVYCVLRAYQLYPVCNSSDWKCDATQCDPVDSAIIVRPPQWRCRWDPSAFGWRVGLLHVGEPAARLAAVNAPSRTGRQARQDDPRGFRINPLPGDGGPAAGPEAGARAGVR